MADINMDDLSNLNIGVASIGSDDFLENGLDLDDAPNDKPNLQKALNKKFPDLNIGVASIGSDDFLENGLDLDDEPKIKKPIISSDPPRSGTGKIKTPKISPEILDRLPSRKYGNRNNPISVPTLPPPGSVGGVSVGAASPRGARKPKKKTSTLATGTVTKSYPSPLPFMHDTRELNKLRPLPKAKPSILSTSPVTAAISAAPGSAPSAVASAVATTPAGASTAVKSFIKNKASSVSGSSVIRKFANRKSIAVGGLAAAGLATSIATSKNRLQDKEQRR